MLEQEAGKVGRRRFIATAGAATALLTGRGLFVPDRADAITYVRRDIGTLTAADPIIVAYRKAVKAMKLLPPTNPLSWAYQAAIHYTTIMPTHPAWNSCQHGAPWFWSWHRMYLYWFERIIRKMSGDPSWALPYWNYTSLGERALPPMFRDPASNLYVVNRNPSINTGSPLPASAVGYASAFTLTNYFNAQSSIEGTPHGSVHVSVGGWISSVPTAAQDPIFYLHHSNIDRLWDLWLAQGGGRHDPTGDASWKSQSFLFYNEFGQQVHMTSCDVLRAAQQLSYTYQGGPPQVNEYCNRFILCCLPNYAIWRRVWPPEPVILTGEVVEAPFQVKEIQPKLMTLANSNTQTPLLQLDGVVADRQPGIYWEVYVGPRGVKPDSNSPSYVGNVALFGSGIQSDAHAGAAFKPARCLFPLTRACAPRSKPPARKSSSASFPRGVGDDQGLTAKPLSPVRIGSAGASPSGTDRSSR